MLTFKKEERLHSKILIKHLLDKGTSYSIYPFKIIWITIENESKYPAQLAISVSKKNFKKAVDRNRIKRLIREAYRNNKKLLYDFLEHKEKKCLLLLVYIAKKELPYKEIESKIILTLQRLIKENE